MDDSERRIAAEKIPVARTLEQVALQDENSLGGSFEGRSKQSRRETRMKHDGEEDRTQRSTYLRGVSDSAAHVRIQLGKESLDKISSIGPSTRHYLPDRTPIRTSDLRHQCNSVRGIEPGPSPEGRFALSFSRPSVSGAMCCSLCGDKTPLHRTCAYRSSFRGVVEVNPAFGGIWIGEG
jgi:hypothetical protein